APGHLAPRRTGAGWLLSKSGWVEHEPYGVIGAITPWNYPFIIAMDCVTPALFAGNAVVIKPSEFTPVTTLLIPDLCDQAGIPRGLVQVVTGDGSTGRALIQGGVDRVVFTGSTATGRKVMETASATLTPVTLELGGKDAAIVLEDADLDRAARGIVFGGFFNAGQTCISVERVFVVRSVYDSFVERVVSATRELRAGSDDQADVGPVITAQQFDIVGGHVRDALARGARALTGGAPTGSGRVFPPTVLVDVDDSMAVMRDETFGPVLPITPVDDEDEAVAKANATGYGLFASVWTGDRRRGVRVARRLRAGGVSVNDVLSHYSVPHLPVGGVGESGFGRRRGLEALDEMTRTRTLLVDRAGLRREPFW
ncbi:MAG TPA: aldehyde dehydrogenase family protein, partial [Longimicrobiales bacterium]|nr:aldehyde dehydrogenase family protein [Longimicrobiales bacterium]